MCSCYGGVLCPVAVLSSPVSPARPLLTLPSHSRRGVFAGAQTCKGSAGGHFCSCVWEFVTLPFSQELEKVNRFLGLLGLVCFYTQPLALLLQMYSSAAEVVAFPGCASCAACRTKQLWLCLCLYLYIFICTRACTLMGVFTP